MKTLQTSPFLVGPQVSLIVYFLVKVNENGFCLEKSMPSPTLPCFPGAVLSKDFQNEGWESLPAEDVGDIPVGESARCSRKDTARRRQT